MSVPKKTTKIKTPTDDVVAVEQFFTALDHPLKAEIYAACGAILAASSTISSGIKWNAPSFRTSEWFATTHLRSRDQVQFIFHLGAKKRPELPALAIDDPSGLLKWLAPDRAIVSLGVGKLTPARRIALKALMRAWIVHV